MRGFVRGLELSTVYEAGASTKLSCFSARKKNECCEGQGIRDQLQLDTDDREEARGAQRLMQCYDDLR